MKGILALDPSSTATGWAVLTCDDEWRHIDLDHYGVINRKGGKDWIPPLSEATVALVQRMPATAAIFEKASIPYGRKMRQQDFNTYATAVSVVRNALLVGFGSDNVYGVTAQTWKASEKKAATIKRANYTFDIDLQPKDHDKADAIMLGVWFIERMRVHPIPPAHECTM